ncbi:hypothetical protein OHC33_009114 [Knufia fluminis]|uniref:Uncharacterized protein n=1 Tax=Knufia fluminis TaxID=191047 RepID=A0AAN8E9Q8_9EURO|nr:hypothetical protein OHC33_009114 [Knufia fluminis]
MLQSNQHKGESNAPFHLFGRTPAQHSGTPRSRWHDLPFELQSRIMEEAAFSAPQLTGSPYPQALQEINVKFGAIDHASREVFLDTIRMKCVFVELRFFRNASKQTGRNLQRRLDYYFKDCRARAMHPTMKVFPNKYSVIRIDLRSNNDRAVLFPTCINLFCADRLRLLLVCHIVWQHVERYHELQVTYQARSRSGCLVIDQILETLGAASGYIQRTDVTANTPGGHGMLQTKSDALFCRIAPSRTAEDPETSDDNAPHIKVKVSDIPSLSIDLVSRKVHLDALAARNRTISDILQLQTAVDMPQKHLLLEVAENAKYEWVRNHVTCLKFMDDNFLCEFPDWQRFLQNFPYLRYITLCLYRIKAVLDFDLRNTIDDLLSGAVDEDIARMTVENPRLAELAAAQSVWDDESGYTVTCVAMVSYGAIIPRMDGGKQETAYKKIIYDVRPTGAEVIEQETDAKELAVRKGWMKE